MFANDKWKNFLLKKEEAEKIELRRDFSKEIINSCIHCNFYFVVRSEDIFVRTHRFAICWENKIVQNRIYGNVNFFSIFLQRCNFLWIFYSSNERKEICFKVGKGISDWIIERIWQESYCLAVIYELMLLATIISH